MTWRSLYACSNGWRGLQPGCFEGMELPSCNAWELPSPAHCILDSPDLGWMAAAGGASELLVVVTGDCVQVTLHSVAHVYEFLPCVQARTC